VSSAPFKKYPPRMIAGIVHNILFWPNSFPNNGRIHTIISPRALIMVLAIHHHKHTKIAFRMYIQVHE